MSTIAAFVYKDGARFRQISTSELDVTPIEEGEFVWIGLMEPDETELLALQARFDLHPLAVEDALKGNQLPKAEVYGDQLFVLANTAHINGGRIFYGQTSAFVGRRHIITVRHGSARDHSGLRRHLEAAPNLLKHGVDYVLHGLLDFIVDGYQPIVEEAEELVLAMENKALDSFLARDEVTQLFEMRQELMRFQRVLGPMEEVCGRLEHHNLPCIDSDVRLYFRDVGDHVRRVNTVVGGLREVLASVFELSTLLEQRRQGAITRQLAAWAAILAVPTAIAGIYGMNFEHMPELEWRWGYPLTVGTIAVVCALLFTRFKKANWL